MEFALCRSRLYRNAVCGVIQHVRIEIDAIRPDNRTRLLIDSHSGEELLVLEWGKHAAAPAYPWAEVYRTGRSVSEFQGELKWTGNANTNYARSHCYSSGGIVTGGSSECSRRQFSCNPA